MNIKQDIKNCDGYQSRTVPCGSSTFIHANERGSSADQLSLFVTQTHFNMHAHMHARMHAAKQNHERKRGRVKGKKNLTFKMLRWRHPLRSYKL